VYTSLRSNQSSIIPFFTGLGSNENYTLSVHFDVFSSITGYYLNGTIVYSATKNNESDGSILESKTYIYQPNGSVHDREGNNVTDQGNIAQFTTYQELLDLYPLGSYKNLAVAFTEGALDELKNGQIQNQTVLSQTMSKLFTSDYALYWFDYHFGYDVVFAEVGWNNTRIEKEIALVRGAANFQQKDWGIIVTWTNTQPPYLESGPKIYEQMRACYEAGAKYLTIFNYPYEESGGYGIMEDEHFEALEQIWADIAEGKITQKTKPEAVLILPQNYGFGLRSADDTIWGFWEPDENSAVIWDKAMQLLETYGYKLDIAYDDPDYTLPEIYSAVYYWNSTLP